MKLKLDYDKLTIYEVESFHKELLEVFQNIKKKLTLDFENISKIDMPAIQLLIATKKACEEKSIKFKLINLSENLIGSFKTSACDTILGVDS